MGGAPGSRGAGSGALRGKVPGAGLGRAADREGALDLLSQSLPGRGTIWMSDGTISGRWSRPSLVSRSGQQAAYDIQVRSDGSSRVHMLWVNDTGAARVLVHTLYSNGGQYWAEENALRKSADLSDRREWLREPGLRKGDLEMKVDRTTPNERGADVPKYDPNMGCE